MVDIALARTIELRTENKDLSWDYKHMVTEVVRCNTNRDRCGFS